MVTTLTSVLKSISNIVKVMETGENPVVVQCDDLEFYVCKHNHGESQSYKLFMEWICYHLMQQLNIKMAPFALVKIKPDHVIPSKICQPRYFGDNPTFATRQLKGSIEINQLTDLKPMRNSIINKSILLDIGFVDIWLANEDRNWNNFNLLINATQGGYNIIPIDHEKCANSRGFGEERPLYLISDSESIITTEQFKTIGKSVVKNLNEASSYSNLLYLRVKELEVYYDQIVLTIPTEWQISKEYIELLKNNLFDENWLNETKTHFLTLLKVSLKLK